MSSDSSRRVGFSVSTPEFRAALVRFAHSRGLTLSSLASAALAEYLRRHRPPPNSELSKELENWLT